MREFFERLLGLDTIRKNATEQLEHAQQLAEKIEEAARELEAARLEAERVKADAETALREAEAQSASPKDIATQRKEPWVGVISTHVNKENVRNGFFELDWNQYFIVQLRAEGYGVEGDPEEEMVDRWFRELCANVVVDGDYGGPLGAGSLSQTLKQDE